ncbi:MOB2 kinase, partial [Atractosteus spatula]|nr:MOB2 kinase [Atractosteus spatula]
MGGCHSYGKGDVETHDQKLEFSNIPVQKLKNNNTKAAPSLEEKPYLLSVYVSERITDMDMKKLSSLPDGFDKAEWMATHTIAFFKHINLFSSALSEFCTTKTCPTTAAPGNTTYYWHFDHNKKEKCSAPLYIDYAMSYIQELLTDENVFPTSTGSRFPNGFPFLVQKIFLYLFRTLTHLYWAHFREIVKMEMHPHLNTLYIHFMTFSKEFDLLEPVETAIMDDLTEALHRYNNV